MKEKEEIEELVNACDTSIFNGTEDNFRSYDEGVRDALNWVLGHDQKPLIGQEE